MKVIPLAVAAALLATPAGAAAHSSSELAALQVGLRAHSLYAGPVDGLAGPATTAAIALLEQRAGLPVTGVPSEAARSALGRYGAYRLGERTISVPAGGWDVAQLQFELAWAGFPSGPFTGRYTERVASAVKKFQRFARLPADGTVGPATIAALKAAPPRPNLTLSRPTTAPLSGTFGPRENRFHTGIDFAASLGSPIVAAADGIVSYAGWHPGGWGYLVTIAHAQTRTMYAHLSRVDVRVGQRVQRGAVVGAAGSSGNASGAHLHFELRLRGAALDPLPVLTVDPQPSSPS